MDVDKCVALHNKILQLGYLGSGKSVEQFEQECKPWFDYFGDEAEELSDKLSPDLIAFFERAFMSGDRHAFFFYVGGLNGPTSLFGAVASLNSGFSYDDQTRFVALYGMNLFPASHGCGLVYVSPSYLRVFVVHSLNSISYDQDNDLAIMCESIWDGDTICNGRTPWYPLEGILEAWLDMVEKGKVIATSEDCDMTEPWLLVPYSVSILQETIDVFDRLVEEIESRMPGDNTNRNSSPLIEESILNTANPQRGFAYHFARKVKRPRFRYIAPGLEIPIYTGTMPDVEPPFASLRYDETSRHVETLPLVLFRATDGTAPCMGPAYKADEAFGYGFGLIKTYPAGLYLSCTNPSNYHAAFEDQCRLVLPYRIGSNGYARKSDGSRFGENPDDATEVNPEDTFADVYEPGYQPLTTRHSRQLVDVLKNWLGMVQRGDWKVDADGVIGGIEKWREADTEESWEKYVIPVTW
jgi:hypothetical protein